MAGVITLALEASTYAGSVALLDGGSVIAERDVAMRGREHEALMPAVSEVLEAGGLAPRDLRRVVCGSGPGAFTSLRIAASIAKGLCMASGADLIPISSMVMVVASRVDQVAERCVVASDAMRGELYVQPFDLTGANPERFGGPLEIIPAAGLADWAGGRGRVIGPQQPGSNLVVPRAASVVNLVELVDRTEPANLAGWEPAYGRLAEAQVKWELAHGRSLAGR
jgi:tRNA threonylcarbamoyladenosine biosynthesis protein TsaB